MNIETMSDQEKSVMLINLMKWRKEWTDSYSMVLLDANGRGVGYRLMKSGEDMPGLYAPENMALLAKVIEWAAVNMKTVGQMWPHVLFAIDFNMSDFHGSMKKFADAILTSGIEAGMVTK